MLTLTMLLEFVDEEQGQRFCSLYYAYEKKMYAVALYYLRDPHKAEDAVSAAFLKIIKHFEKILSLPCTKIEPYLVITVKNTALDLLRAEARQAGGEEDFSQVPAMAEGPEEAAGYRRLVELIRAMPEPYRQPLELVLVLEWPPKEAARLLKCSENTLNSRLRRGRELLKQKLREEGYHDGP